MSKYLETLVENMLADNVPESDIQLVIKEMTKESPLKQDDPDDPGVGATILDSDTDYSPDITISSDKIPEESKEELVEPEIKIPEIEEEEEEKEETKTTEEKIKIEDASRGLDRPDPTRAGQIEEQKQEQREYIDPFANEDLTIKPDFFDLDEDQAKDVFKSLYGGLPGFKISATGMGNAVRINFPGGPEEGEVFDLKVRDKDAAAKNLNNALKLYIDKMEGGYKEFDVYAKVISGMRQDFSERKTRFENLGIEMSSEDLQLMQSLAVAKHLEEFIGSEEYEAIQNDVVADVVNPESQLLQPLANKVADLTKDMSPEEERSYRNSDKFRNTMLDDLEDIIYDNIHKHPDYIKRANLYFNAASTVYGGKIETQNVKEAELQYLPWFVRGDRDFIKGLYKTLMFSFPLASHSTRMMNAIGYLAELEEFEKEILKRDPNSMVYFQGGTNEDVKKQKGIKKYPSFTKIPMPTKREWAPYVEVTSFNGPTMGDLGAKDGGVFARKVTWMEVYGVPRPKNLHKYLGGGPLDIKGSWKVSDLLKRIDKMREFYRVEITNEFMVSQEYQGILESLGTVEFFTKEGFNWDIDDWQEACGTQLMQCFSAIFTSSLSVKSQEQAGVFIEAMYHEAAKIRGMKVDAFKMLPMEKQGEAMLAVIDSGLADNVIYESEKHGSRAALMESFENAFIITKGVKFIPRELSLTLLRESVGRFFKGSWKYVGKDLTATSIIQLGIEIGQELSGDFTRSNLNIGPGILTTEFWNQREKYKEVAFQTIITAPFIFLGMKGASTTWNRVENKLLSFKSEELMRRYVNKQIAQLKSKESEFLKTKKGTEEYNKMMRALEASLENISFITNPKHSNRDKLETIQLEVKRQEYLQGIPELEAQLKKLEKDTPEYKSIYDKIRYKKRRAAKLRTEEEVIKAKSILKSSQKRHAQRINNKGDKQVVVFKTKDEFILYLDSKNNKGKFSTEEIESILYAEERVENAKIIDGKLVFEPASFAMTSFDNSIVVACEEILDNMVAKMDGSAKSQWAVANVINHEILHVDMFDKSYTELKKMQDAVVNTMTEAAQMDPQWLAIYTKLEERHLDYADLENTNPRDYLEEWFTSLSDALRYHEIMDFTIDGSAYWSDIALTLEEFLQTPSGQITEETALEFIKKFNERGKRNGKPVVSSWWLDEYNRPVINTRWEIIEGVYSWVDMIEAKAFREAKIPKKSKATRYSDATEIILRQSEKIYGTGERNISEESTRIQNEIIKAASYIFDNKDGQYTDERALQIQNDVRDGQKKRYEDLFVLNNVKGVLNIIDRNFDEGKKVSRFDFEAAVFAELGKIIKDYKPLLTEEEWNKFMSDAKEKNTVGYGEKADYSQFANTQPTKITNKDVDGEAKITNPVNFWAYAKPILQLRIAGIWDDLVFNQIQQYTEDVTEATNLESDYDIDTILDLEQMVDEYEELSELKKILKIENTDPIYTKINDEVYRLMGEKVEITIPYLPGIYLETFAQDFRNESRELFWKDLKNIVGTPKKFKVWLRKTDKDDITNAQKLYEVMPQAVMNTSYTEFTDLIEERMNAEQSEKSLEVLVKNKYAGNDLRRKKEYTPEIEEQWIARIAPEVRPDMAQEGILKHLSDVIARDAVMQTIQSQKFKDEFGIVTSEIMQVAQQLQRGIATKFSRANGTTGIINHNKINSNKFYQQAFALVRIVEDFTPDTLEEAEDILNSDYVNKKIKNLNEDVKDFILSLWDKGLIANGQSIRFGIKIKNYLEKNDPELLKKWQEDGSWSSTINPITKDAKDELFNGVAEIARKKPWLFKILKFDILGKHYRYLDGALTKKIAGWDKMTKKERDKWIEKYGPDSKFEKNPDGTFKMGDYGQRFLDLENEIAASTIEAPPHVQAIMDNVERMVGGKTLVGITKEISNALDELRDQNITGQEAANEIEKRFGDRIAAINHANQEIMVEFGKAVAEAVKDGSISKKSVIHLFQIQSSLQNGVRAYTTLELISILEKGDAGLDTRVGVEHLTDNAQTCFALAELILNSTTDQTIDLDAGLRDIFKDHNLWLTRKKYMDYIDDEGGKNNPNKIRRVLMLTEKDLSKVYSIIGANPAREAILRKEGFENLDEETAKVKNENKEEEELKEIIENILYGETKEGSVFDFDETLAFSDNVVVAKNKKTGETVELNSDAWKDWRGGNDWTYDFTDFNYVTNGKPGPLMPKLINQLSKYGADDVFILTARAKESAPAILDFVNGQIDIYNESHNANLPHLKLKNIVGLGESEGKFKAQWIEENLIKKGYNDIYFVDDAHQNVEAVQDMLKKYPPGLLVDGGKSVLVEASKASTDNKVIFMVGGPGAGKTTVANALKLGNYKMLNPDTKMERDLKKAGLSLDRSIYEKGSPELSQWAKIQQAAIKQFKLDIENAIENGEGIIIDATGASDNVMLDRYAIFKGAGYQIAAISVETSNEVAIERNQGRERVLSEKIVTSTWDKVRANYNVYKELFGDNYFVVDSDNLAINQPLPNDFVADVSNFTLQNPVVAPAPTAKLSRSNTFNAILEDVKGVDRKKEFSKAQAKVRGKKRGRFNIFISPSAEDFQGLLLQMTGKGKKGKQHMEWYKENLVKPYLEGVDRIDTEKVKLMTEYKDLVNKLPGIKKKLKQQILREDGTKSNFTNSHAVRVYLWDLNNITIPGISKRDRELLVSKVGGDSELLSFANRLSVISRQKDGYVKPTEFWAIETIASDIHKINMTLGREEHLKTFIKHKNEIFNEKNLQKIEAVYGPDFREALENILWRMTNGTNKNQANIGRLEREWDKWVNNSVGAIMFLNMRSATLQTLSTLNYIDWKYNNPLAAAKAFANQKEFWRTFVEIWNSPMLQERRSGKRIGIHEAELSARVAGSTNPAKAVIAWLLEKGFTPTQLADNFAISMGGASFLMNARKHHAKTAPTLEEAEKRAWEDFRAKTQESQQSADPMYISQQQASGLGRIILAFKNTPMQYARLMKKEITMLMNGTSESPAASVSKIAYYAAVQNFMFTALQTALFAALDEDDPDWEKKEDRVIKGMVDSILYGMGLQGVIVSTVKNGIITFMEQEEKGWNADHGYTIIQFANLSPSIGSKLRKVYSSIKTYKFNKETIDYMSLWDPANPAWLAVANLIEAVTNAPTGQAVEMINNLFAISDDENEWWQNLALLLGWNTWDVDVKVKSYKIRDKAKKFINNMEKEAKNIEAYNKEVKEGKKDLKCVAAAKDGRCGNIAIEGTMYCTVHEKVEQREDEKEFRCKGKRTNGEQCNMMTTSKSGYCVYHD